MEFFQHGGSGLAFPVISTPGVYRFVPRDDCVGYATLSVMCREALQPKSPHCVRQQTTLISHLLYSLELQNRPLIREGRAGSHGDVTDLSLLPMHLDYLHPSDRQGLGFV